MAQQLTTGGGKAYIPSDEIPDRVASMLGATCSGFSVEFGGDREVVIPNTLDSDIQPLPDTAEDLSANKKRKLTEELMMAQRDKELAMTAYFWGKREKVDLENIKLRLEIEMMKKRNNLCVTM